MVKQTDFKIPYGVSDFRTIRNEGLYYVDKTEYLAKLEDRDRFVFYVRPRRFGKSRFLDMLRLYYDRNEKANFEKLFGGLWIGEHPTPNRNRYLTLALDFSQAGATGGRSLQECFEAYLLACFQCFVAAYPEAELRAKAEEGVAQLRRYAADPLVPRLAEGTRLHLILYQFRGKQIHRLEELV